MAPSSPMQISGAPRAPEPLPPSPPLRPAEWFALIFGGLLWALGLSIWTAFAPQNQPVLTSVVLWSLSLATALAALFSAGLAVVGSLAAVRDLLHRRRKTGPTKPQSS